MKQVYINRLLKLATHLESRELGHKKFDFTVISNGPQQPKGCGTNGCALGEMPIVFPGDFKYVIDSPGLSKNSPRQTFSVFRRLNTSEDTFVDAANYFGISSQEANWLFMPYEEEDFESIAPWNKSILTNKAIRKQVAKGIRNFVVWREKEDRAITASS